MKRFGVLLLAAPLVLAGCSHRTYYPPPPPPPPGISVGQMGYDDGFNAARNDVAANRPPSYEAHPRYRNPPVPPPAWGEYRSAFRNGYQAFLHGGPR